MVRSRRLAHQSERIRLGAIIYKTPWVGVDGVLVCIYLMAVLPLATWRRLLVWLLIGLAIYFVYGRRNVARTRATALTGERGLANDPVLAP